jgi:hypothetical protein
MEFIKLMNELTPEEKLINHQIGLGIRVQSVALPKGYKIFKLKSEAEVMDWLENKVHNVNTAFHKINSKYTGDTERVNWNNNKMQNQRFLETKNLFKRGLY